MLGGSKTPTLQELERPERLHETIAREDGFEDCLSCRLMGSSTLVILGAYTNFSGQRQLQQQQAKILQSGSFFGMKSRRAGIAGLSLSIVGMGLWRLVN